MQCHKMNKKYTYSNVSKYKPEFCQVMLDYFEREPYKIVKVRKELPDGTIQISDKEVANDLPLFSKVSAMFGCSRETLEDWKEVHPEWGYTWKRCKELQEHFLVINSLRGLYQQPFAIFTAKNILRWTDRHEFVEMKFIFDIVGKVSDIINKTVPDQCPHCKKDLLLRENTLKMLEDVSKSVDNEKKMIGQGRE